MRNVEQVVNAIASRQRVLEAMPGTTAQLCSRTALAQPTLSKLLRSLCRVGKAYQSGWQCDTGGPPSAVFTKGPQPAGFRLPEKPARLSREELNDKRRIARLEKDALSQLTDDELWPKTAPDPIPEPHYLMALFGKTVTIDGVDEPEQLP